ncbi:monovalent cation/H(+) antiporter subunit G [Myxococcus sp. AM009]|uniref:monovalent cation/H(+) antiporter subunit G n=1 Tax=unclassified Myxococcus TaxID=2648731 RepID=UPI0015960BBB|nr:MULTISPECIES: monovalent cation/H(+) antiporter subunit G [unclassified Myxococcus]NVI97971.1 monovalent cation/H(+) antiporter subunit G [Myxococcus sp. AM009]NVJ15571.1 monovalent cation/H(+) antiporter subunit G [Myxococcus sp. AM010]
MKDFITATMLLSGALLMLLAGLGLFRMPDLFLRLQAAAKASSLGVGLLLGAAALGLGDVSVIARAVLGVAFVFVMTPVATLLIAQAAFRAGLPLWERTHQNDLEEHHPAGGPYEPRLGPDGED